MQEVFADEEFDKSAVFVQELMEEGREEGAHQSLVAQSVLQLRYKLGEVDAACVEQINALSRNQLEDLGIALFKFDSLDDLRQWLDAHIEKPLIH